MSVHKQLLPSSCEIKQVLYSLCKCKTYLEANVFELFTVTRLALDIAAPLKFTLAPLLDNRHILTRSSSTAQFSATAATLDVSFTFSANGSWSFIFFTLLAIVWWAFHEYQIACGWSAQGASAFSDPRVAVVCFTGFHDPSSSSVVSNSAGRIILRLENTSNLRKLDELFPARLHFTRTRYSVALAPDYSIFLHDLNVMKTTRVICCVRRIFEGIFIAQKPMHLKESLVIRERNNGATSCGGTEQLFNWMANCRSRITFHKVDDGTSMHKKNCGDETRWQCYPCTTTGRRLSNLSERFRINSRSVDNSLYAGKQLGNMQIMW